MKDFKESNDGMMNYKVRKGIDLINQYNELPTPNVLWNGIVEGACGLITGVAKTGKTTFAENLAISFAVGKNDFYGHTIYGAPKKVLFVNLEEKLWRVGRRNKTQISALTQDELDKFKNNYFTAPEGFPEFLNSDEDWKNLSNYIKVVNPQIIFIDSLTHMFKGEIEKSDQAQGFVQIFKKHILKFNKTVFVIHHNTKGNDKPMTQDNIAGSRVIMQEFDFALGFSNIPTQRGGTYSCMLYNKDAEKTSELGSLYTFDKNYWIHKISEENIYNLYSNSKTDGRTSTVNTDLVYNYIQSQASQGSPYISSLELKKEFVETSTMTKQTLYTNLSKLITEAKILKDPNQKGIYILNKNEGDNNDERNI